MAKGQPLGKRHENNPYFSSNNQFDFFDLVASSQPLQDFAIAEFIAKSYKLCNFCKSSQIFVIAADFQQILGLDASRDVIATRIR